MQCVESIQEMTSLSVIIMNQTIDYSSNDQNSTFKCLNKFNRLCT